MKNHKKSWLSGVLLAVAVPCMSFAGWWSRPVIVPLPDQVAGVTQSVVSLNGNWKFTLTPPEDFWKNSVDPKGVE